MAKSVEHAVIDTFIDNAAWAIFSTYHRVLKVSPGTAIIRQNMLFNVPFVADWKQIGDYKQSQTDCSNERENKKNVSTTITQPVTKY